MHKKELHISALIISAVLLVGCFFVCQGVVIRSKPLLQTPREVYDWSQQYPFAPTDELPQETAEEETEKNEYVSVSPLKEKVLNTVYTLEAKLQRLKGRVDSSYKFVVFFEDLRMFSTYLNRYWSSTSAYDRIPPEYIRLGDYLAYQGERVDYGSPEYTQGVLDFKNYLDSKGIPFLYNCFPDKFCREDNAIIYPKHQYRNENLDDFIAALEKNHVDYIDYRVPLHQQGLNHHSLFYNTDHHWTIPAGLWATRQMAAYCNEHYGFSLDTSLLAPEQFHTVVIEDAMFGSMGASVGKGYIGAEDFSIPVPDYPTSFHVEDLSRKLSVSGDFSQVMYDQKSVENAEKTGGNYAYEMVAYGNSPHLEIRNNNVHNGIKAVVLRDSFSIAMVPYFSLLCEEVHFVDVRQANGNFNGSVKTLIEQVDPDIVMMMYNISSIFNKVAAKDIQ